MLSFFSYKHKISVLYPKYETIGLKALNPNYIIIISRICEEKMGEKYNTKIPRKLADLFQEYIEKNPQLGFNKVSQYILYVLQENAKRLLESGLETGREKLKTIKIESGSYTKNELLSLFEERKQ